MNKSQNAIVAIPVEVQTKAKEAAVVLSAVANKIVVASVGGEEKAYDALKQIKVALNAIEKERKKITQPMNQAVTAANTLFKTLSEPFKGADSIIRDKIMEFRQEQEIKAVKERERRQKIQVYHEEQGHKTYDLTEVEPEVAETTTTVKRWTYKIIDIWKVPRQYLLLDSAMVREQIRRGARKIEGLKIYQEEGLRV